MSDTFTVNVNLSDATVGALGSNFKLYGFKGIDGSGGGVPVVWFSTDQFSDINAIQWQEQYAGYTSTTTDLVPMAQITASDSKPMNLGQQGAVGPHGVITVNNNGSPGVLEILNTTTTQFTCGVSVFNQITNSASPICAFPLFGQGLDEFAPIELVFLMFATNPVNTGTVIEQSFGPGILIDMTGQTAPVSVSFDINLGWTGPGNTTNFAASAQLVPMLINPGTSQQQSIRAAKRAAARSKKAA